MANTITAFNTFVAGTRAQASEVNTNFSNFRGDLIPINENTITASDNSHDLGTTDHRWKDLHLAGTVLLASSKTTATGADEFLLRDTEDNDDLKKLTWTNLQDNILTQTFNASGSAPAFAVRAFAQINNTSGSFTIATSGNMSSLTNRATGTWLFSFTTPMQNTWYATFHSVVDNTANAYSHVSARQVDYQTTTGFVIYARYNDSGESGTELAVSVVE